MLTGWNLVTKVMLVDFDNIRPCIVEGRGANNGQIGIAAIDLNRPEIEVSQFLETCSYSCTLMKMLVWMPLDILLPHSALDQSSNMNRLVKLLQQSEFGLEYLKALCHPYYLPSIYAFQEKYYGLSAVSALFNYLESAKRVYYAPKSLKVEFGSSSQSTLLDATSALRLGLVGRLSRSRDNNTLFKAINYTCTLSGARRLRASLLEPPKDLTTIISRQDSVEELIAKPRTLLEIQNVLTKFPAIDSLLSMCIHLSDFPAPLTDLLTATSTSESAVIFASSASLRARRTTASPDLVNDENLLTPGSDVEMSHDGSGPGTSRQARTAISRLNSTTAATNRLSSMQHGSDTTVNGKGSSHTATSTSISAVTIEKNAELRITKLIAIKHMLDLIKPLYDALKGTSTTLLKTYREILSDRGYGELLKKMMTVLQPDACFCKGALQMRVQKCFAIKPGVNVLLDLTRRAYAEQVDDISRYVKELASKYSLPLRIGYNKIRGFFIQIPEQGLNLPIHRHKQPIGSEQELNSITASCSQGSGNDQDIADSLVTDFSNDGRPASSQSNRGLPRVFIKVQIARGIINCTTAELVKLNERVKGSLNEVYLIADNLVCKLIHDLHPEISLFYRLSEAVSGLDLLCTLARVVVSAPPGHTFVRPVFGDTLAIQNGRHMIHDRFSNTLPVSNNTFASTTQNVSIILGTSMSGKTTYLTQVALMQILAQIGAFVPAKFAAFRLMDKIFARMGCRDDMTTNASTFALEMREVGHVFRSATDNSLILIDDLGLSTTDEDCFSLSFAVCDALAKMRAFSFFTTSDTALAQLQFQHLNIETYHFVVGTQEIMRDGRQISRLNSADCSFSSIASTSRNDFSQSSMIEPSKQDGDTRTRYKYTYKLKKGVGKEAHSVVEQLSFTALDPTYIALTKKYYDILVNGKAMKRDRHPTAGTPSTVEISESTSVTKRARLEDKSSTSIESRQTSNKGTDKSNLRAAFLKSKGFVTPREINNVCQKDLITEGTDNSVLQKSPLKSEILVVTPVGIKNDTRQQTQIEETDKSTIESFPPKKEELKDKQLNVDLDDEESHSIAEMSETPKMDKISEKEKSEITITTEESEEASKEGVSDRPKDLENYAERSCYTTTDRMMHSLIHQTQMLACVARGIDRISSSAPLERCNNSKVDTEDQFKVQVARRNVLSHLNFLRNRYAGVIRSFLEN
nr:mutS protein 4 [Hymenolepis microstoma]